MPSCLCYINVVSALGISVCYRQKMKMDNVTRREKFKDKTVQSYGLLLSKNVFLEKKLMLEEKLHEALVEETKIQAKIITQLKSLLSSQTKPLCDLGHKWCRINHHMYNYSACHVKTQACSEMKTNRSLDTKVQRLDQQKFITKLSRKVDHLQSKFGVPAVQNF